ncbi:TetR/AcrR family transcriptional regulator [Nonomuraea endophytica]|uniref:AcrR family transcriptional regulator n=1 Tax=Nonomuraea endophytica TaxID=714136 RepID=A0A7W8A203_9ACTN|nr:TetR family transcriptional regulator [Nonomuraea endophytica]MBB5078014.1 AcrR family transcriptional regulator [Nonomuraea endophytica]
MSEGQVAAGLAGDGGQHEHAHSFSRAAEAGVEVPMVYYFFGSKEKLFAVPEHPPQQLGRLLDDAELSLELVLTHLMGLVIARYQLGLERIAAADRETLVSWYAPRRAALPQPHRLARPPGLRLTVYG